MPKLSEILAKLEGGAITTTKKAAGFLSEGLAAIDKELEADFVAAEPAIKQDLTSVITDGIPVVWPLVTGGSAPSAIIAAGYAYFMAALPHLFEEIWTVLAAELSMKVKSIASPTVPQVITQGLVAAVTTEEPAGSAS